MIINSSESKCIEDTYKWINQLKLPFVNLYSKIYCKIGLFPSYGRDQVILHVRDDTNTISTLFGASGGSCFENIRNLQHESVFPSSN